MTMTTAKGPSRDNPLFTDHPGLTVVHHDLGREDLPIYRSECLDQGDRVEFTMPDGRRATVSSRSLEDPPTTVIAIEYRTCDWSRDGHSVIQVLGYELSCGTPPSFSGCPCLDVTFVGGQS